MVQHTLGDLFLLIFDTSVWSHLCGLPLEYLERKWHFQVLFTDLL